MKHILITGANSYIGTSFENYVKQWPEDYHVDTVDMIDGSWRNKSFSGYDTVFHVAGIAHIRETKKNAHLYYEINRDLAVETAQKAKVDKVLQLVYLSSMSVYGIETGIITKDTIPCPKSNYGKSKAQAEAQISKLSNEKFKIAILRPPIVYGKGCKGNYQTLAKWSKWLPVFPDIHNRRSMIKIEKLCEYIKSYIDSDAQGLIFPQDENYICTSEMVKNIAFENGHAIKMTKAFNWLIYILCKCGSKYMNKIFGSLYYQI